MICTEEENANYIQSLRHVFHKSMDPQHDRFDRLDVGPDTRLQRISDDSSEPDLEIELTPLVALSNPLIIQRLADRRKTVIESHRKAAHSESPAVLSAEAWNMDTLSGPNITDKNTILTFARMTANDYIKAPGSDDWQNARGKFNYSSSFGWKGDALRGHVYSDKTNDTVVISLKGTSPALFDGSGTTTKDKENDNLFFSCCCGQGGSILWREVCDCQTTTYTANLTCIIDAMSDENRYYAAAIDLYYNVTEMYPDSNVWLTGHSLGGAMTSLLGLTFGLPVVTFEAVPEALPAARLGLPSPPGYDPRLPQSRKYTGAFHFGHTADPIYMGSCNGINSFCTWGGYALETACHTGQLCTYDTVADKGWGVSLSRHSILPVIADVLEAYDSVPSCAAEEECVDCLLWKFFRSNGSESTTSRTTSTTTTISTTTGRTSTCKTPGWWGCLDETTATTITATTATSSPTAPRATTATTTSTQMSSTSSSTPSSSYCETPGLFWGCWDEPTSTSPITSISSTAPTETLTTPAPTQAPGIPISSPSNSLCQTPGIFWGCWDKPTTRTTVTPTSSASPAQSPQIQSVRHLEFSGDAGIKLRIQHMLHQSSLGTNSPRHSRLQLSPWYITKPASTK
ncbi:hypothetical protein N7481_011871 [Penicillium waksmanii]|uniref:uncharacterized protein n=1 Tax=Penicillium waksmanii TaxID=69791 RepID=UPI002546D3D8|nr:uncharacterized protein N7481_011871 [Penicillium waksmanii]KAJ5974661.1 hypothetical protein N7481_011871 [Penicillium waksmanii]